jgi:hypothetical protein
MNRMDPSTLEQVQMVFRDMARECKRFARGQNTAFYQAKFFASLLRISSVAPTRVATRENTPNPGRTEIAADDLAARLHQAGNQVPDFSVSAKCQLKRRRIVTLTVSFSCAARP